MGMHCFVKSGIVIAFAVSSIAVPVTSAFAADLRTPVYKAPPPIVYSNWSGCYIGAGAGYTKPKSSSVPITGDPELQLSQTLGNVPLDITPSGDGYLVGPQIGCNYEVNRWVFGGETDLYFVDAERTYSGIQGPNIVTTTFSQDLKYLGTVRARLGISFDQVLLYATGGLAYGKVDASARAGDAAGLSVVTGSRSDVQFGYTIGGGVEYALNRNWSIKGEYLYYDLGRDTLTINAVVGNPETAFFNYETAGHIVRGGLNYRF